MNRRFWMLALGVACGGQLRAATLEVGPGRTFDRIEAAVQAATTNDTILVYPAADGAAYEKVAVLVRKPGLTLRAAPGPRVLLRGVGFDYAGRGFVPRAIVQFNREAAGGTLEGFELSGAHNDSHNGAGVRINLADNITIRNCDVHGNDMGIMSNGDGTTACATNQRMERCLIRDNGDRSEPGYNHNLYLGGGSVVLDHCEIRGSLTGHNVKSRAHRIEILGCYIHDSANRELDFVDAVETGFPGSDALLVGNYIAKGTNCPGNRGVIHCGQDGGKPRTGTLSLVSNTVVTTYATAVLTLSSPDVRVELRENRLLGYGAAAKGRLIEAGGHTVAVTGRNNRLTATYADPALAESEIWTEREIPPADAAMSVR